MPATPIWVGFGTYAAGSGDISPGMPSGWQPNDLLLLFAECIITETISTPSGYTLVTGAPVTTGTSSTSARLYVFYRRAQSGDTAPTITDPGDHCSAIMHAVRGVIDSGNPWDVVNTGIEDVADTTFSFPSVTTTVTNCLVVNAVGIGWDANTYGWNGVSAYANANLTGLVSRSGNSTNINGGGGIGVATGVKASAGSVGNTTMEATAANNTYKAMMTIALKGGDEEAASPSDALGLTDSVSSEVDRMQDDSDSLGLTDSTAITSGKFGADTNTASDAATISASLTGTDTSTAVDAATAPPATLTGTDITTAVDTATISVQIVDSDTVSSVDASSITASFTSGDTSAATETQSLSATFTSGDTTSAVENVVPGVPTGLTVTPVSDTELDVSWNHEVGAIGYDLERDSVIIVDNQAGITYSDTGLSSSTTYSYRVRSVKSVT